MVTALRGPVLTYTGDPFEVGLENAMRYEADGIVVMKGGVITHFGAARDVAPLLESGTVVTHYGPDSLISAGFVDSHVHYPQTPMIASYGEQLLDWLNTYTFPIEKKYADKDFARGVAKIFLRESLKNGITTACVYCTVHPQSVDALFEEAEMIGMRIAAGKVMMDRNAPDDLRDSAQNGYEQSKTLIGRWHNRGRLMYAITPRFAATSSHAQLEATGALCVEYPDCYLQTHVAESKREVEWIRSLFPERKNYLDVYDHYSLCRPRAVFGHGIHLSDDEMGVIHGTGSAIAHCPTSNFFLGSGVFDIGRTTRADLRIRVGLGTDIGAGTSFSMLATLNEAYKAAQFSGYALSAGHAYYLATRGSARAMYLEDRVGSIAVGMEADVVVLDMKSTPLIEYRMAFVKNIEEALFVQMMLGDDRAVRATYIAGKLTYNRGDARFLPTA